MGRGFSIGGRVLPATFLCIPLLAALGSFFVDVDLVMRKHQHAIDQEYYAKYTDEVFRYATPAAEWHRSLEENMTNETSPVPTVMPTVISAPTHAPIKIEYIGNSGFEQIIALVINVGSMLFVMYLLRLLLYMAHLQIERLPDYRLKQEAFQSAEDGQNWSWDFVLVTTIKPEESDNKLTEAMRQHSMLRLVEVLRRANLETEQFKSQDWTRVIIKIRATAKRLKEQADKINMRLRLDEKEVKKRLSEGQADVAQAGEWLVYPRKDGWFYRGQEMRTAIKDTESQCPYAFYEYMYGEYDSGESFQTLYHKYANTASIFRSVDRIKLILSILKWPAADNGAGLALEKLLLQDALAGAFPLHNLSELRQVQRRWLVYWAWPWNQPFTRIKDYFGEKIAMYFLFLGHYTAAVMVAALVGTAFYLVTVVQADPNSPSIPFFCVFMALWATLFVEFWKRRQSRFAMMWGMVGSERAAEERPEFTEQAEDSHSPVTGEPERYFPPGERTKRTFASTSFIAMCGSGVLTVVVTIFFIKANLTARTNFFGTRKSFADVSLNGKPVRNWGIPRGWEIVNFSTTIPSIVVSLINAIQIFAFEPVFSRLAKSLTDYECHRTDTEYEDSLTAKVFVFQFINSFTSYLYIAFFKEYQSQNRDLQYSRGYYACIDSCMSELQTQLGSIFISKVIIANVKDILLPYSTWSVKRIAEMHRKEVEAQAQAEAEQDIEAASENVDVNPRFAGSKAAPETPPNRAKQQQEENQVGESSPKKKRSEAEASSKVRYVSPAEEQMQLEEYNILLGPFADYRDLVIIYGYTVLFVAAFPLAPLMALVNSYVQIRADAWHISVCCQRPWPSNAEDIGTWAAIIELTSYFAVIVNSLIIVYTGTFLDDFNVSTRLLIFLGLYHGLFFIKYVTALLVDDIPSDVALQVARQEFTEAKLIKMQQDDVLEVDDTAARDSNLRTIPDITIHDKDDDVVYLDYPGYENDALLGTPHLENADTDTDYGPRVRHARLDVSKV